MLHHESWNPINFEVTTDKVKGQGDEEQKQRRRGFLHSCECWLLLVEFMQ